MWLIIFLLLGSLGAQSVPDSPVKGNLDFGFFKAKVQPLLVEKRPGHARCVICHSTSTAFRLQPLPPGGKQWSDEQSQKNFEVARRFVLPGNPQKSRLLTMPLAEEAGGIPFHPGGKHWESQNDPEWKVLAEWVNGAK